MGLYLGANELGGGSGGGAVGDLSLKPAAKSADLYVDTNGSTWLKSGVVETDLSAYPNLPFVGVQDAGSSDGTRSYFGASPASSISPSASYYAKFLNDSFNNTIYFTARDTNNGGGYSNFAPVTLDGEGKIENPYIDGTTTNKRWGATQYSKVDTSLNNYGTLPQFDGTDHWALRPNFTPASSSGMPYRGSYSNTHSGAGELNTWKLSKVTGGSTTATANTYTYSAGDDITPSGVPTSGYDISLGSSHPSYNSYQGNRIGSQFAVTDTQVLLNVKLFSRSGGGAYYYYFNYSYPWQVHAFNKSTGAYEGMLYNNSYVINDNGGDGYLILKEPNKLIIQAERGEWVSGLKEISFKNKNHVDGYKVNAYVDFGVTDKGFGTPIETDNSGRMIIFNPDQLDGAQQENATGSGNNSDSPNQGGTIDIYTKASGIKTLYLKGLTTSTTVEATAMGINTSNQQISAGPNITSEDAGHRLYIKAL